MILPIIDALPWDFPPSGSAIELSAIAFSSAAKLTVDLFNNRTCQGFENILPNSEVILKSAADFFIGAEAVQHSINFAEEGHPLIVGYPLPQSSIPSATVGTVYKVAQISSFATPAKLLNNLDYPYFTRISGSPLSTPQRINDLLVYYQDQAGLGWTAVAVLSGIDELSLDFSASVISSGTDLTILTYQQYLEDTNDLSIEFSQIKNSGARVIITAILGDYVALLEEAQNFDLVGDSYVWLVSPAIGGIPFAESSPIARGTISVLEQYPDDSQYLECFVNAWMTADPIQYPLSGTPISSLHKVQFDTILTAINAFNAMDRWELLGTDAPVEIWNEAIRSTVFEGLTGTVEFTDNGDRYYEHRISFYDPEQNEMVTSLIWNQEEGFTYKTDVIWNSGNTTLPDLDIRPGFSYWSCEDGKEKYDKTGKTISLNTPSASYVDEIESHYHCDNFIDCRNMSDETNDCSHNYVVLYIVFGAITGLLMLLVLILFIFIIIFGIILRYRRLRTSSPIFMILLLIAIFVGYSSVFAFFGKPHPVACAFQPWLLGVPSIAMIASLAVKNYRLWRIFRKPGRITKISDMRLFLMWCALMAPGIIIIILWMIISTPTAALVKINGEDHFICTTGGFTGYPGGYVFFSIFVVYTFLVLVFGALISFATRNVPSMFNEVKLLTISIYNLGFLAIVIIPVYILINPINPFVAWILRTISVLYALTATLITQFTPKIFGVIILDKGKNIRTFKSFNKKASDPISTISYSMESN